MALPQRIAALLVVFASIVAGPSIAADSTDVAGWIASDPPPRRPACRDDRDLSAGGAATRQAVILLDPRVDRELALQSLIEDRVLDLIRIDQSTPMDYVRLVSASVRAERLVCLANLRRVVSIAAPNPVGDLPPPSTAFAPEPGNFLPMGASVREEVIRQTWAFEAIKTRTAWEAVDEIEDDAPSSHSGVMVALLDSGVMSSHPDLKGNLWRARRPVAVAMFRTAISCSRGFNIVDRSCNIAGCTRDQRMSGSCQTGNRHGTGTAGVVSAVSHNNEGIMGVSRDATIVPIVVLNDQNETTMFDLIEAIDIAIQISNSRQCACAGLRVMSVSINVSAASDFELVGEMARIIDEALKEGIIIVGAAGNEAVDIDLPENHTYPASLPNENIVAVTMSDMDDGPIPNAGWGSDNVDLAAPGEYIWTTSAGSTLYQNQQGTSFAVPFVSGAAAFLMRVCPSLPADEIRQLLIDNVDLFDPVAWKERPTVSGGRLNLLGAVNGCIGVR